MKTPSLSWILRLVVSAVVLALLFYFVPVAELAEAMRTVPVPLWLVVVAAFLGSHAVTAFKWRLLILGDQNLPVRAWMTAHFAGLTANLFLPGVAGGDVVRAGYLIRQGGGAERVAAAGIVDRIIDTLAVLLLAATGAFLTHRRDPDAGRIVLYVGGALVLAGLAGVAGLWFLSRRGHRGLVGRLVAAIRLLATRPDRLCLCLAMSIAIQALLVVLNALLGRAVGVAVPLTAWFTAWPLAKLIALAPISLAGLGVREAALVALMRPFGAPAGPVMAAGLLWETVQFSGGLVGWIATLSVPASARTAPQAPVS